jgi:hypothetical protein
VSDQPPFQPPNQPPPRPTEPPAQPSSQPPAQPSYDAPTMAPGSQGWSQQPSSYPQGYSQGYPPSYGQGYPQSPQPGYPSSPGTPPGAGGRNTPWGLLIGSLVAGLVIGGGVAGGVVALTAGDPKDSDEYQALSDDLDEARASLSEDSDPTASTSPESPDAPTGPSESTEPAEPTEPSEPSEGGETGGGREVDGWTLTEPEITADSLDDFQATMQATNGTGGPEVAYFEVTVSKGSTVLTEMTCVGGEGEPVEEGTTVDVSCFTSDDYTDDYDTVDITAGF